MKKVTLYLDEELWQLFRVACLQHRVSASDQVESLMAEQLNQWNQQPTTTNQTAPNPKDATSAVL